MLFVEHFILLLSLLYTIFLGFIFYGSLKQKKYSKVHVFEKLTILIPAKDEEENIADCLNSLLNQTLNSTEFELIVLNDNSKDNTKLISESYNDKFPNFKLINLNDKSENHLIGKSRAISLGVKEAKNDIILICDADCKPNKKWLETIMEAFDETVGVVSGFTLLESEKTNTFGVVQNIDWVMLQGIASGAVGLNLPISCIGSNFAFRREAYEEVGGYEKLPFSITEDLLLYKTISKQTSWKFVYPLFSESVNVSKPMNTIKSLYQQRKRWAFGSLGIGGFGLFSMLLNGGSHLFSLGLFIVNKGQVLPLVITLLSDLFILIWFLFSLKRNKLLFYSGHYIVYYYLNVIIFPIMFLFDRNVVWKDRIYNKGTT